MNKIKVCALAGAMGIAFGILVLLLAWAGWLFNWGVNLVTVIGSLYIGFAPTFVGGLIGFLWGFLDGFVAGVLVGFLYNRFAGD